LRLVFFDLSVFTLCLSTLVSSSSSSSRSKHHVCKDSKLISLEDRHSSDSSSSSNKKCQSDNINLDQLPAVTKFSIIENC
jgi:hypothetical protein